MKQKIKDEIEKIAIKEFPKENDIKHLIGLQKAIELTNEKILKEFSERLKGEFKYTKDCFKKIIYDKIEEIKKELEEREWQMLFWDILQEFLLME